MSHPYTTQGVMMEHLPGVPSDAETIGSEMKAMGETMVDAAATLKKLADSTDGMHGKAVQTIRDEVGDSHVVLDKAGVMYEGVGSAIETYGSTVIPIKSRMDNHFDRAEELWAAYSSLPGDKDGRSYGLFSSAPEEGSTEEAQHKAEDAAKLEAYNDWLEQANGFDTEVGLWEEAWNLAATDVNKELTDDLKDGFWDKVDAFVEGLQTVLAVAGIIVGILALIFGGPILALIGSIIAVVTLALTIYQAIRGDASGWDIAIAVIGVIPIGSLGKLAEGLPGLKAIGGEMVPLAFKPSAWSAAGQQFNQLGTIARFSQGGMSTVLDVTRGAFQQGNPNGLVDLFSRTLTGKTTEGWKGVFDQFGSLGVFGRGAAIADGFSAIHAIGGGLLTFDGRLSQLDGGPSLKDQIPVLKHIW